MGYQLRMHNEVRDWLTGLRDTEPESARLVGEAVLALLDAGGALGAPLVVPLETVLRQPNDPREALDLSYQRQLEILTKVRRGVADVATSRKRVELQLNSLQQQAAKLVSQREQALKAGREELAEVAGAREAEVREQLSELRSRYVVLTGEEERLAVASQRLQAKVERFRVRKETVKASYTAAEASQRVQEAMADLRAETRDLETRDPEGGGPEAGDLEAGDLEVGDLEVGDPEAGDPEAGDPEPEDHDAVPLPPGMRVLLPGAPDDRQPSLLFVVQPQGTALLVGYVTGPGRSPEDYRPASRLAAGRLPPDPAPDGALPPGPAADGPAADGVAAAKVAVSAFSSYDAESVLDEFFPGAETEVEIGAGALVARSRAHTLAEARQRMRLTQAQVAGRMNVRQERVSAIERAEPGATEVRTLAAYVGALGGRLEIVAHVGDERILLR